VKRQCILYWLILALSLNNCSIFRGTDDVSGVPPGWVLNTPMEKGKIFGVGIVGKTFFQDDAWRNAADAARKELAKSLQGRIESAFLSVQSSGGNSWADEAYTVEATSWSTDIVMNNSQIVAMWYDGKGVVPGGDPGATYALAVIDFDNTEKALKPKIENNLSPEEYEKVLKALSEDFKKK